MQSNKPWKLVKSGVESERSRAGSVVGLCVNAACLLSVIMSPFMPGRVARLNCSKMLKSGRVYAKLCLNCVQGDTSHCSHGFVNVKIKVTF